MKSKAGSTSVWFVVLLTGALWVAFSFRDQAASAWHKAVVAADPASELGTSAGCPALLNSANPDDIQYCVKRGIASAHAESWAELGCLAALVSGPPVVVLGIFSVARWVATIIKQIPSHDAVRDRRV